MSRRWRYPRSRRGDFYGIVPTATPASPPAYVAVFQEPSGRNSRARITRRGQFFRVTPATVAQVLPCIPAVMEPAGRSSRLVATRVRRGQFLSVPRRVCPPVPSTQRRRQWMASPRRGEFFIVPLTIATSVSVWTPPMLEARRPASWLARRGEFLTVPLVGLVPAAAPWVPPLLDTRRAPARPARRGEFFAVPLVGAAPHPPAVVPQVVRSHIRVTFGRRGRFWLPPLVQQVAPASSWVPQVTRARRNPAAPVRRGEYLSVPLPRATCPTRITSRRTGLPACRRGQTWRPPWIFVPPAGPGPYIPKIITSPHRPPGRPTRRGVFIEPAWPSMSHSCTTPRPNSGSTARQSTGSTSRPNSGITVQPCI